MNITITKSATESFVMDMYGKPSTPSKSSRNGLETRYSSADLEILATCDGVAEFERARERRKKYMIETDGNSMIMTWILVHAFNESDVTCTHPTASDAHHTGPFGY
eukprot:16359_1